MIRNSVGLDIGASTIKIVELKKVGDKAQLVKAGMVETPRDPVGQKKIISKLLSDFRVRKKALSVAVPGQSAYIRYINLPPLDATRIKQMMEYEAKQQIPVPLEEVVWSYQLLPTRDSSKTSIVLVAAKSEAVEKLAGSIRGLGIEPYIIDYVPLASYNALKLSGSIGSGTSILIDIGAESTSLSIEMGGSLCWTRSIPIGGVSFTQSIEKALGQTPEEAEILKREKGGAPGSQGESRVVEAMAPPLRRLASEIERSVTFFQAELGGGKVERIILSGGGGLIKGIAHFLESHLGVRVVPASPLKGLLLRSPVISGDQEAFFATAIGLALRGLLPCPNEINLLPLGILKKKEFRAKRAYFIISAVLALLTAGVFREFFMQDYKLVKAHIEIIEAGLEDYREYEPKMRGAMEEKRLALGKVEELKGLATKRLSLPALFRELTLLLPDGARLKDFSLKDGVVNVSGIAPLLPTIADFREKIEASPLFGAATIKLGGEPGAHEFSFTINVQQ
jgi:type IV pilus assembly protein PilM